MISVDFCLRGLRVDTIAAIAATMNAGAQKKNTTKPIAIPWNIVFGPGPAKIARYATSPTTIASVLATIETVALLDCRCGAIPGLR